MTAWTPPASCADIYHDAKREIGYNATRFVAMVRELGGLSYYATSSSKTTMEIYSHVSAAQQREAVEVRQRALAESHVGPDFGRPRLG